MPCRVNGSITGSHWRDSISVIAINKGSAQSLNISVNGYTPVYAVQSAESGDKSKTITAGANIDAPAKSITTVVFTTSNTAALQCEDSPIEDPYIDPSKQLADTLVIVDYANETAAQVALKTIAATSTPSTRSRMQQPSRNRFLNARNSSSRCAASTAKTLP